jgi:tetratricopeptide (TPR) repeat protein
MQDLAIMYSNIGGHNDAIVLSEQAVARRSAALGPNRPETISSILVLAMAYSLAGRDADALWWSHEAVRRSETLTGPGAAKAMKLVTSIMKGWDGVTTKWNEIFAVRLAEQAVEGLSAAVGRDNPDTLSNMDWLGQLYKDAGRLDDAIGVFEKALDRRTAVLGAKHQDTLASIQHLGERYCIAGRWSDMLLLTLRLKNDSAVLGPDHPKTLETLCVIALCDDRLGHRSDAEAAYRTVIAGYRKAPAGAEELGRALAFLGGCLTAQREFDLAEAPLRESLAILDHAASDYLFRAGVSSLFGDYLVGQGRRMEAEPVLLGAYEDLKDGELHHRANEFGPTVAEALNGVIRHYEGWERPEKLAHWRQVQAEADQRRVTPLTVPAAPPATRAPLRRVPTTIESH